jgi:hypothetical protein
LPSVHCASALFDQGLQHMSANDFATGCPELRESYRIEPRAGTLFTLAECEAKWGKGTLALPHYIAYLELVTKMPIADRARQETRQRIAERQIAVLERDLPWITFRFPPNTPAGTVIRADGALVTAGRAMRVDIGEHQVQIETPDGKTRAQPYVASAGEKRTVDLELPGSIAASPYATPTPVPTPAPDRGPDRTAVYLAATVGGVGVVIGSIAGILAIAKKSVVDLHCRGTACDAKGKEAADAGATLGTISTVGFGVGLAGLAAAGVLLLLEPSTSKTTTAGVEPTFGGVRGRF